MEEEVAKEKAERTANAIKDKEVLATNVAKAIVALKTDPNLNFVIIYYKRYQSLESSWRYLAANGYEVVNYPDTQSFRVYRAVTCDNCNLL